MSVEDVSLYQDQLQQVQAALSVNPDQPALVELEQNLKQFIALATSIEPGAVETTESKWKEGAECQAVYTGDGQFYNAVIDKVHDNGMCTVTFPEYGNSETVKVSSLREREQAAAVASATAAAAAAATAAPAEAETLGGDAASEVVSKKRRPNDDEGPVVATFTKSKMEKEEQREAKRKKNAKKKKRREDMDKVAEKTKNKWQSFAKSSVSSQAKTGFRTGGKKKKSIFASPDAPDGKVGVGTCGIGGKGMTDFHERGKWSFDKADE
eukprot:m.484902 g.484902  ORF g.484902 m.484902 type:complete len:267 (-) comp23580_c0_seq1:101-901(-)